MKPVMRAVILTAYARKLLPVVHFFPKFESFLVFR